MVPPGVHAQQDPLWRASTLRRSKFSPFSLLLGGGRRKSDAGEAYMLNFSYEDDIKIKNKHVVGVSRTFYLSTETISRPPQSEATIPLT
jgi:hypothetical protein